MSAAKLLLFDQEIHLDTTEPLSVGDTLEIFRGNGPREGDFMGTARVKGFDENGAPDLELSFHSRVAP